MQNAPPLRPAPALQCGDRIVILSPSSKVEEQCVRGAAERLLSWGLTVEISPNALSRHANFAGTDEERLADLQAALDDPTVKAILCSRGGYGLVRLLDRLSLVRFAKSPKWIIGFSDVTALHGLLQSAGYQSIHASMTKNLAEQPADDPCVQRLRDLLFSEASTQAITSPALPLNIPGTATGAVRGGNLSVLNGLRATPYDFPAEGTILLIEDIGERPYQVERMMYALRLSGALARLSGLIVGQFTEYTEDRAIGLTLHEMLHSMVHSYGYPVAFDFPVGHTTQNTPLILGSNYELQVTATQTTLQPLPQ